jgi:hypothetical protein
MTNNVCFYAVKDTPDEEFELENKLKINFFILEALKGGNSNSIPFLNILQNF